MGASIPCIVLVLSICVVRFSENNIWADARETVTSNAVIIKKVFICKNGRLWRRKKTRTALLRKTFRGEYLSGKNREEAGLTHWLQLLQFVNGIVYEWVVRFYGTPIAQLSDEALHIGGIGRVDVVQM